MRATFDQPVGAEEKGIKLLAHDPVMEAGGGLRARVQLWNGSVKHEDTFLLSSDRGKVTFSAKAAAKEKGVTPDEVESALLEFSAKIQQVLEKVEQEAAEAEAGGEAEEKKREAQSEKLVRLATEAGLELFKFDDRFFATFPVTDAEGRSHEETWLLCGKTFRRYLRHLYYQAEGGHVPGSQALQDAIDILEARADYGRKQIPVFLRAGHADGKVYVDLVNDHWEVAEVSATGWRVLPRSPVKFIRNRGMEALPYPEAGGSIEELRPFVNVQDDEDFVLVAGWAVGSLNPHGAKPGLEISGGQGSAKTTGARVVRRTIDPNKADLRSQPKDEDNMIIAARGGFVFALDNLSNIPQWMSDAMCRLSTGAGLSKRELYTDDDEVILTVKRSQLVTGIGETVIEPDLADRYSKVTLRPLTDEERRAEEEFWADFDRAHPRILGAILKAVASALKNGPSTKLERLPRMADFAKWVTAAEGGLGWTGGRFLAAYNANRTAAAEAFLESNAIGPAIAAFVNAQPSRDWSGAMKDLLQNLNEREGDEKRRPQGWPKTPRGLSSALRRAAPALRRVEKIAYTPPPKRTDGKREEKPLHRLTLADIEDPPMSGGGFPSETPISGTKSQVAGVPADMSDIPDIVSPSILKEHLGDTALFADGRLDYDDGLLGNEEDAPAGDPFLEGDPSPWR